MAFKGTYVNVEDLIERTKTQGPLTTTDAQALLGDQPSTRIVRVEGALASRPVVEIHGKVITIK